jgi:hypothetical protein
MARQSGIDTQTVRVLCKKCGCFRVIAHSGRSAGRRPLVKITRASDPSHVLHAEVIEIPEEQPIEEVMEANPGFRDLDAEAHEKGLSAVEREFLPLLEGQACPRCHQVGQLELSQIDYIGRHVRY